MLFNFFKRKNPEVIIPSTKVYLKQVLHGCAVPAFIHNHNYFFVDIDIYENGRVHCWNFSDFEGFENDVKKGWVMPHVPNGQAISIHGFGSWKIESGIWLYNRQSFIDYTKEVVKYLNLHLDNLYKYREKKYKGMGIGEAGLGTVYKVKSYEPYDLHPLKTDGNGINLFYTSNNESYLVKVNVFADDTLQIARLESSIEINIDEFEDLVNGKVISTELPVGTVVHVYGLGKFTLQEPEGKSANVYDKLLELKDMLKKLKGEPTAIERCKSAYEIYMANPNIENKESLKKAYENIPEHNRMYIGDMDTKDVPIRMIIYGEQELENWSHYKLAQKLGHKLPSINIPKPKGDKI